MNAVQLRRYEMLVRVRDFGAAHADLFLDSSLARETFAAVGEAVEQLTAHTVSKLLAVRGTPTKEMARAGLHDRLAAISQTARAIAEHTPGLEEKFVLPEMPSDQVLLMAARVFARDAEPLADRFIAHVMPKTFLADLEDAIGRFEQAIHQREAGKDERIAARARIKAALASGDAAARALDAMVGNRLRDDPATMAVWKRDRRVQYPNRPRTVVDAPAPEPVPTVATGAAAPPAASAQPASEVTATAEVAS
jgi:hypothetical protein